jgi:hypothetical protein
MKLPRLSLHVFNVLEAKAEGLTAITALVLIVLTLTAVKQITGL